MTWYMNAVLYIWGIFKIWIETIFVIPFQNIDMLWLLVPVWIAWFFAEFYQEKIGTSMGNAITNAVVVLWASIDCTRQTVKLISEKIITSNIEIIRRFALIAAIFIYGFIIILFGIKGNKVIRKIGRVRIVTYVFVLFVPIFYNVIPFSLNHLIATLLFFPLFYGIIELIDKIIPDPKAIIEDLHGQEPKTSKPETAQITAMHGQHGYPYYQHHYSYYVHPRYGQQYMHYRQPQNWNTAHKK